MVGSICICESVWSSSFPRSLQTVGATQGGARAAVVAMGVRTVPVASPPQLIGKVTTTAEQQGNDEMISRNNCTPVTTLLSSLFTGSVQCLGWVSGEELRAETHVVAFYGQVALRSGCFMPAFMATYSSSVLNLL